MLIDWICSVFNFQEYSQQNFNRRVYFLFSTAYVHNTKMQADLALFQIHFFLFHQFLLYLKILNIMQTYFCTEGSDFKYTVPSILSFAQCLSMNWDAWEFETNMIFKMLKIRDKNPQTSRKSFHYFH